MNNNGHSLNGIRTAGMYTLPEAARLAKVSPRTVRNWLFGFPNQPSTVRPLFDAPNGQGAMVSFLQLVEVVVAGRLRKAERASFKTVYQAYRNAKQEYPYEYPFAHLELRAIGGHIVHFIHGQPHEVSYQALDQPLQWTLPGLVEELMEQIHYDSDSLAAQWSPLGKDVPIIIDPRFSAGAPTIVGRGVTVQAIHSRFKAGLLIDFIAEDLVLERTLVERALQYAEQVAI